MVSSQFKHSLQMDRTSLLASIAGNAGLDSETAERILDAFRDTIAEKCSEGDAITLPQFGTFESRKRMERVAIHPATGKRILVPPKVSLVFRPSSLLKQKVNTDKTAD